MASGCTRYFFSFLIFVIAAMPFHSAAQAVFKLGSKAITQTISSDQLLFFPDSTGAMSHGNLDYSQFLPLEKIITKSGIEKSMVLWATLQLKNESGSDQEYILQTQKWGFFSAVVKGASQQITHIKSGSLLRLTDRSQPSNVNALQLRLKHGELQTLLLRFESRYSIYAHTDIVLKIAPQNHFERLDRQRLLWQGVFFGIILVMALYNLFILFAVKDISYFYYVLSIVSIGLYFSFYYGFGIEYLWPRSPLWDTFCFAIINPFTSLCRILFTRTYLHTPQLLPRVNKALNVLAGASVATMCAGLGCYLLQWDLLKPLVLIIAVLGVLVLLTMLIAGAVAYYYDNYEPAKYFIAANILLIIGAIAFIVRETGLMSDNFFTRYLVQYAVLIQAVVLSLGLASRLNRMRLQLTTETLEKERIALEREKEKKQLIEQQKHELLEQVREKTADLHLKNSLLEETVTQLKDSEYKLSELNHVKDKLFSVVSHDLRNPLATMQSFLKLVTAHDAKLDAEERKKLFFEAQQSLNNMNELLYNLLQWSKSQMNLLQFRPDRISIRSVIDSAARLVQLHAHMKQVIITTNVDHGLYAFADKDMVEFVVRNLLSNAIKFSQRESSVEVSAVCTQNAIYISVADRGIGLNETKRKKLLERNTTITRRGTEKEKGTGLGLLISKEFIEKNHGHLQIESVPGVGSVFSFDLPQAEQKVPERQMVSSTH